MMNYGHNMTASKMRVGGSAVQVLFEMFKFSIKSKLFLGNFC